MTAVSLTEWRMGKRIYRDRDGNEICGDLLEDATGTFLDFL